MGEAHARDSVVGLLVAREFNYALRRPYAGGTTPLRFDPAELLEKLAALVPAPRTPVLRYHGS